ncbi:MAG TPA: tetratricopeptide repeat protein [Planctomycetaceae bacterium]|nr:tetratricopeptide repeat protein [Planctomycetaceae bacterium]
MSDINSPDNLDFLKSSPCLTGERVVFTGTLASMTHHQAHDLVKQYGGVATYSISRQTTMLVLGEEGWPIDEDGLVSQKLKLAEEYQAGNPAFRILHESDWLYLLGIEYNREEIRRLYTPAMLQQLLGIPTHTIRAWERAGLIRPVRRVYRLPYFEFEEVTAARRLSEMLGAGVSRSELEKSLKSLERHFTGLERPLAQLDILARDSHLFYRDHAGLVEPRTGQRVFDFDNQEEVLLFDPDEDAPPEVLEFQIPTPGPIVGQGWSADDWFEEGCRLMDEGELAGAVEAFRMSLIEEFDSPETHFHLAEALYRQGKIDAALERSHVVVELDHNYVEAWTQIGCLHGEMHEYEEALDSFEIALRVHPDCPEAHWFRADTLRELGRTQEAVKSWHEYLKHDSRGPWAEIAKQYLDQYSTCDEVTS